MHNYLLINQLLIVHDHTFLLFIVADRPEMQYLHSHVMDGLGTACQRNPETWLYLGLKLMPDREKQLRKIHSSAGAKVTNSCVLLFDLWLQQPKASWRQLIEALKNESLDNLATQIEGKLEPSTVPKSMYI